jgi:hypothetical protein
MVVDCIQDKASLVKYFLSPGSFVASAKRGALDGSLQAFLRVHGGYLSGGSLVTTTDEPLSGWSVAHSTSAHVGDCKGGGNRKPRRERDQLGVCDAPESLPPRVPREIRDSRCRKANPRQALTD